MKHVDNNIVTANTWLREGKVAPHLSPSDSSDSDVFNNRNKSNNFGTGERKIPISPDNFLHVVDKVDKSPGIYS